MNTQRILVAAESKRQGARFEKATVPRDAVVPLSRHDWRTLFICCVLAGLLTGFAGCGRHRAGAASAKDAGGAGTAKPGEDPTAMMLAGLTQLVRKYGVEQRQAPQSLDELVAKGYLNSVPPAPNGKRFAINKQLEVYLADR